MTSVMRVGIIRLCGRQSNGLLNKKNLSPDLNSLRTCGIAGKEMRDHSKQCKVKPWPYREKRYGILQTIYDKTTKRFDENSKVICVEGPIAAGKTKLAKELADELGMFYVPDANLDLLFINPYGYDMRQLDPQLPAECRSYDERNFCLDPHNKLAAQFQCRMYYYRYDLYVNALAHVLSTGQGVVIERSPYSDFVFLEAMHRAGYISKGVRSYYEEVKRHTIPELMKPHLVIYLDCPADVVKSNIKARNCEHEVKSKVFTVQYLKDLEMFYKQHFLKDISTHAEILIYDWTEPGDTEVIVEDIERINFEQFEADEHNKKMKDWRIHLETEWCEQRMKYTSGKFHLMNYFNIPRYDVPEILCEPDNAKQWRDVWFSAPGMRYTKGYNADMGDEGLIFKSHVNYLQKL